MDKSHKGRSQDNDKRGTKSKHDTTVTPEDEEEQTPAENDQDGGGDPVMEPFESNPKIMELTEELDKIDAARLESLEKFREQAREVREEMNRLIMIDEITLRRLSNSPLSQAMVDWIDQNGDDWKEIKKDTEGKVGSRRAQRTGISNQPQSKPK